ncbi:hypothetical protein K502DRAFT_293895 [Neoconidiobolus thromboides FSU 785]|nr:hypothetical protein K502DRAFT_293895 [Neoconidiobolus thromboides FSU 785]
MAKESNLTQTTYRSPDKIPFPPRIYYNSQEGQSYEVHFAGSSLGDGNGNIHEGVISSLLDEAFARVAFQKFHTHYLFTANLSIDFMDELKVDSFFLIHCQLAINDKNYKAEIRAEVKEVDSGKVVANATGLFLVPKDKRHLIK